MPRPRKPHWHAAKNPSIISDYPADTEKPPDGGFFIVLRESPDRPGYIISDSPVTPVVTGKNEKSL